LSEPHLSAILALRSGLTSAIGLGDEREAAKQEGQLEQQQQPAESQTRLLAPPPPRSKADPQTITKLDRCSSNDVEMIAPTGKKLAVEPAAAAAPAALAVAALAVAALAVAVAPASASFGPPCPAAPVAPALTPSPELTAVPEALSARPSSASASRPIEGQEGGSALLEAPGRAVNLDLDRASTGPSCVPALLWPASPTSLDMRHALIRSPRSLPKPTPPAADVEMAPPRASLRHASPPSPPLPTSPASPPTLLVSAAPTSNTHLSNPVPSPHKRTLDEIKAPAGAIFRKNLARLGDLRAEEIAPELAQVEWSEKTIKRKADEELKRAAKQLKKAARDAELAEKQCRLEEREAARGPPKLDADGNAVPRKKPGRKPEQWGSGTAIDNDDEIEPVPTFERPPPASVRPRLDTDGYEVPRRKVSRALNFRPSNASLPATPGSSSLTPAPKRKHRMTPKKTCSWMRPRCRRPTCSHPTRSRLRKSSLWRHGRRHRYRSRPRRQHQSQAQGEEALFSSREDRHLAVKL
jgi:hypothetical protein